MRYLIVTTLCLSGGMAFGAGPEQVTLPPQVVQVCGPAGCSLVPISADPPAVVVKKTTAPAATGAFFVERPHLGHRVKAAFAKLASIFRR